MCGGREIVMCAKGTWGVCGIRSVACMYVCRNEDMVCLAYER